MENDEENSLTNWGAHFDIGATVVLLACKLSKNALKENHHSKEKEEICFFCCFSEHMKWNFLWILGFDWDQVTIKWIFGDSKDNIK